MKQQQRRQQKGECLRTKGDADAKVQCRVLEMWVLQRRML